MNTILFDLDGTLIPMYQDEFIKSYFKRLCKRAAPYGFETEKLVTSLWQGTMAMIKNDSGKTNHDIFWEEFSSIWGKDMAKHEPVFDDFYLHEFNDVQEILPKERDRRELIEMLKAKGYTLVLATNPVFPAVAVKTRLAWLGLEPADFSYISTYENSHFCKPNPKYFEEILGIISKAPKDCIMIGNNTSDDMSALKFGIECYLVTDYLENEAKADISVFRNGNYSDLQAFLTLLPPV